MVLAMVAEAVKGAAQEVKAAPTAQAKVQTAWGLTRTICRELLGLCSGIPYAYHATSLWRNPDSQQQRWRFNLLKNVRYGYEDRNLLDVYTPTTHDGNSSLPVLMFVHGGVWSSGDKLLFSPVGATLAHHGIVALLVQYTLYPQVLAKVQVKEISRALTWALDNVSQYGGDSNRIHVMGHSSGAHLCAMLFSERARRNLSFKEGAPSTEELEDKRGPHSYIALAGVYNIGEHYVYEKGRELAAISCMKPANGGLKGFSAMSPEILFGSLLALKKQQTPDENAGDLSNVDSKNMDWVKWSSQQPPFVLFASDSDIVVPPTSTVSFHGVLQELGCKTGLSVYKGFAHDDFVCWVKGFWGKDNPNAQVVITDVLDMMEEKRKFLSTEVSN